MESSDSPAPSLGQTVSQFDRLVCQLFRKPGDAHAGVGPLLRRAAAAHLVLLRRAAHELSASAPSPPDPLPPRPIFDPRGERGERPGADERTAESMLGTLLGLEIGRAHV